MTKISVVVPIYNCSSYIEQLISTLNSQTISDLKIIFVDDCSTDDSLHKLKFEVQKLRYHYILTQTQTNAGAGGARNEGMKYVDTMYFSFIDSDDFISSNYYEALLNNIENSNADIAVGNMRMYWNTKKQRNKYSIDSYSQHIDDKDYLTATMDFGPCAKLFKTILWDESCSFPHSIHGEDGATIPVLYDRAKRISFEKNAIYYYYQTPYSRSRNGGKYYNDGFEAWKVLASRISNHDILEYKFITIVGYGVIMNAIRFGVSKEQLKEYSSMLSEMYPNGLKNKYFKTIPFLKKVFIHLSYKKRIWMLKALVRIRG